jgi:hypothetical protein
MKPKCAWIALLPVASLALVGGRSAAQEPGPAPAFATVMADDPVVLRIEGPERIRTAFRATNVSHLLGAREASDFWELTKAALRDDAGQLRDDAGVVDALLACLDGYSGTATLGLLPHRMSGMRLWADGVLVLEPDGRTDLAKVAAEVQRLLGWVAGRGEEVELGGLRFPLVRVGPAEVGLPTLVGERLVALFGRDLAAFAAARSAGGGAPFVADAEFAAAPIALRADLRVLVERRVLLVPPFVLPGPDSAFGRRSGLRSLGELRASIRPLGPHVGVDVEVAFRPGVDRGVIGVLTGEPVEAAEIAGLVPASSAAWYAGRIDAVALFDGLLQAQVAGFVGRDAPDRVAREREAIDEATGFDLGREVLARLDGPFVVAEPELDPEVRGGGGGLLAVARVTDGGRLAAPLAAALRAWWWSGRAVPLPEDEGALDLGPGDLVFTVRGDLCVVATGADAEARVRAFLAGRGHRRGEVPAVVTRARPQAPPGLRGFGALDLRRVLSAEGLQWAAGFVPLREGTGAAWAAAVGALEPQLEPFGAERAAVFTGLDGEVWRLRLLW